MVFIIKDLRIFQQYIVNSRALGIDYLTYAHKSLINKAEFNDVCSFKYTLQV